MTGSIVHISVGWVVEISDGPKRTIVDLAAMRQHCRPERLEELLADLTLICQDAQAAQDPEGVPMPVRRLAASRSSRDAMSDRDCSRLSVRRAPNTSRE